MITPGKMLGVFFCAVLFNGCTTTTPLYNWGDYQNQVYARFSDNANPEQQIAQLEKTLQTNKHNKPAPPGFHAHLGLLYGETGQVDKMREQFIIEKNLYPEATTFMDFLLTRARTDKGTAQ